MNNELMRNCVSAMGYFFLRSIFDKEVYSDAVITELSVIAEELMKDQPDPELIEAIKTEFVEGDYVSANDLHPYDIVDAVICADYGYEQAEAKHIIKNLRKMRTLDTPLIALIGRSGVGKTSVAKYLEDKYDWTQVESYTTRPKRNKDEKGHQFITEPQFNSIPKEEIMAYMRYRGYQYGATEDQLNEANLYVVDPGGYKMLKERYKNRPILAIKLAASRDILESRMRTRGTSEQEIADRIEKDNDIFDNFQSDVEISTDNLSISEVGEEIIKVFQSVGDYQEDHDENKFLVVEALHIDWDASFEAIESHHLPEATTILGAFKVKDYWKTGDSTDQEKLGEAVCDWLANTYEFAVLGCDINVSMWNF